MNRSISAYFRRTKYLSQSEMDGFLVKEGSQSHHAQVVAHLNCTNRNTFGAESEKNVILFRNRTHYCADWERLCFIYLSRRRLILTTWMVEPNDVWSNSHIPYILLGRRSLSLAFARSRRLSSFCPCWCLHLLGVKVGEVSRTDCISWFDSTLFPAKPVLEILFLSFSRSRTLGWFGDFIVHADIEKISFIGADITARFLTL